jgi:hypothetical protein
VILLEVTEWTMIKLKEAFDKYNGENRYSTSDYSDLINRLLELYLKKPKECVESASKRGGEG